MINKFLNTEIKQSYIIKILGILLLLFCVVGEFISLDKFASLPYFFIGVISSLLIFFSSNKIFLFSPFYNFFTSLFFAIIFSAFYYFANNVDIMHKPLLRSGTLIDEINVLYLLFFISMIIPIAFSLFCNVKFPKFRIPQLNEGFLNKVFVYYIILEVIILCLLFILTGTTPISAIINPMSFRNGFTGIALFPQLIFSLILNYLLIIVFFDTLKNRNKLHLINKLVLLCLLVFYTIIAGRRGVLVFAVFYFIMIFSFVKKIRVKHLFGALVLLIALLCFSSIYLKYRNTAAALAYGNYEAAYKKSNTSVNLFADFAERNDSFVNSINFFKYINRYYSDSSIIIDNPMHLKEELIYQTLSYIPREQKNKIYGGNSKGRLFCNVMSDNIYDNSSSYYQVGFDFGGIANFYWVFGVLGIIISGFLYGVFVSIFQLLFNKYKQNECFTVFYLLIFYSVFDMFFKTGYINCPIIINLPFNLIVLGIIMLPCIYKIKIK